MDGRSSPLSASKPGGMDWSRDEVADAETDNRVLFFTWSHHPNSTVTVHAVRSVGRQARLWKELHTTPGSWVALLSQGSGCRPPAHIYQQESQTWIGTVIEKIPGSYAHCVARTASS